MVWITLVFMCKNKRFFELVFFVVKAVSLVVMDLQKFSERAKQRAPENKKFLAGLKRKDPRRLDDAFHSLHDEVFAETIAGTTVARQPALFFTRQI